VVRHIVAQNRGQGIILALRPMDHRVEIGSHRQ
jgi:hypothetical protein